MKNTILTAIAVLITSAVAHAEAVLVTHSAVYAVPVKSPLFAGTVTQGELQELRFVEIKREKKSEGSPEFQVVPVEGPLQGYTLLEKREKDRCLPRGEIIARLEGEMPNTYAMLALPRGAKPRELTPEDKQRLHPKQCLSHAIAYDVDDDQMVICAGPSNKLTVLKRRGQGAYRVEETFPFPAECH